MVVNVGVLKAVKVYAPDSELKLTL
jgi:hypothetical protein